MYMNDDINGSEYFSLYLVADQYLFLENDRLRSAYVESLDMVRTLLEDRFGRIVINDEAVEIHQPATDWNIRLFMEVLKLAFVHYFISLPRKYIL